MESLSPWELLGQQPCPLRRLRASSPRGRALGKPVKFPLDEQSLFVSWTVVPCCLGQRQLDKCVVQKRLPSVARPAFLRHIAPRASSRKWPDLPKPLPMGEVALRSNDGEGKPGTKEPLRSDGQALCQRETSAAPVLPRQQPCPLRRVAPAPPEGEPFTFLLRKPLP